MRLANRNKKADSKPELIRKYRVIIYDSNGEAKRTQETVKKMGMIGTHDRVCTRNEPGNPDNLGWRWW